MNGRPDSDEDRDLIGAISRFTSVTTSVIAVSVGLGALVAVLVLILFV